MISSTYLKRAGSVQDFIMKNVNDYKTLRRFVRFLTSFKSLEGVKNKILICMCMHIHIHMYIRSETPFYGKWVQVYEFTQENADIYGFGHLPMAVSARYL